MVEIDTAESYISFRATLMALLSLKHLELRLEEVFMPPNHDQLPRVLPTLELLRVVFATCRTDFDFINRYICAPSLISLSLAGWDSEDGALDESNLADSHMFPILATSLLFDARLGSLATIGCAC